MKEADFTPEFVNEKEINRKKRNMKISKAHITGLLNKAKLDRLEKTIAENT